MNKKIIYLGVLCIAWGESGSVQARITDVDRIYINRGTSVCNGESQNCYDFIGIAKQLSDERIIDGPSITFE